MTAGRPPSALSSLFPLAPPVRIGWRGAGVALLAAVLGVVLQVARLPAGVATNTVWADDGSGFLGPALQHGWGAFAIPYSGYLVSVTRVMAAIAATLPLRLAAFVLGAGSALVVCLVAGLVYLSMRGHIPSRGLRLAFAAVIVLIPAVGLEVDASAANLHWYLVFAAVWALLARPPGWGERLAGAAVCFVAAASDPLVALLLPLAALRLVAVRSRRDSVVVASLVAGLVVQLPVIAGFHTGAAIHPSVADLSRVFAGRVLLPVITGSTIGQRLWNSLGWVAAIAAAALVVAALMFLLAAGRRLCVEAFVSGGLAVLATAFVVAEMWVRWNPVFLPLAGGSVETGARYWTVPSLLLWSAAFVAVGSANVRQVLARSATPLRAAVVVWMAVLCAADFIALNPGRDAGPFWSEQIAAAARACHAGARMATVTTPPDPTWNFQVPCSLLRD